MEEGIQKMENNNNNNNVDYSGTFQKLTLNEKGLPIDLKSHLKNLVDCLDKYKYVYVCSCSYLFNMFMFV